MSVWVTGGSKLEAEAKSGTGLGKEGGRVLRSPWLQVKPSAYLSRGRSLYLPSLPWTLRPPIGPG